ncbi:MAG: hypothetical protein L3J56_03385 [Bacteroidales bacterium]|nr:hypothetical protein [Bacteroidales bacterium]
MRAVIINILFIFFVSFSFAQNTITVPAVDKKTYQQYLNKNWNELIKTGKQSLKKGIDFYYLQYRMGIAYYEKKQYAQSVKYFENIYTETPDDELIQEYLYYAYLLSGRIDDAKLLSKSFDNKLTEKLHIETEYPFIRALYIATQQDINEDYSYIPKSNEQINQKTVTEKSWYNISLEHAIGKRITVFHGYSHLEISNNVIDTNPDLPSEYTENLTQNEYYFSLKYHLTKGLNLTGGLHVLHSVYFAPNPMQTFGRRQFSSALYYYPETSITGSLKLDKSFSVFNISAESSISNINKKLQIQPALSLRIYPFGNDKFYSETRGIYLSERSSTVFTYHPVIKQSFGFTFLKYSFFSPSVTYGDLINYTSYNAFIVNNDIDKTKFRLESYLNIGLAKGRFNIFLNYQYNIKENTFTINGSDSYKQYINQSITGGIKWYFKKY